MSQYVWTIAVLTERETWPRAASMISTTRARSASSWLAVADFVTATAFLRGGFSRRHPARGAAPAQPLGAEAHGSLVPAIVDVLAREGPFAGDPEIQELRDGVNASLTRSRTLPRRTAEHIYHADDHGVHGRAIEGAIMLESDNQVTIYYSTFTSITFSDFEDAGPCPRLGSVRVVRHRRLEVNAHLFAAYPCVTDGRGPRLVVASPCSTSADASVRIARPTASARHMLRLRSSVLKVPAVAQHPRSGRVRLHTPLRLVGKSTAIEWITRGGISTSSSTRRPRPFE
jgi:hypothetical protein